MMSSGWVVGRIVCSRLIDDPKAQSLYAEYQRGKYNTERHKNTQARPRIDGVKCLFDVCF